MYKNAGTFFSHTGTKETKGISAVSSSKKNLIFNSLLIILPVSHFSSFNSSISVLKSTLLRCPYSSSRKSFKTLSLSKSDGEKELKKQNTALRDVYIMMVDDARNVQIIKKEG